MKKILLSSVIALGLSINLSAYEVNGDLGVKWTGFKTEKKAPVSGTFKDIKLNIEKNDDLSKFLTSAKVEIKTASFDSKNPFRDKNITSTLFSLASSETIKGSVKSVDVENKKLILNVTMNEVSKEVSMAYDIKDSKIVANGTIEILDFAMKDSFMAFAKKCAGFHGNKSFSDVNIEFTIPYK
jgi:polyisoprenoid-binding protein YceI